MQAWPILAALLVFLPLWRIASNAAQPAAPLFWGILAILATWIAGQDRWVGIVALYVVTRGFLTRAELSFETTFAVLAGLLLLVTAQRVPMRVRSWLTSLAVASGILQIAYSVFQWWLLPPVRAWIAGSIGNPVYMGSYLAIAGAVAPGWLLPIFIGGVILSRSVGAAVALAVALAVRYRRVGWRPVLLVLPLIVLTGWHRSLSPSGITDSLLKRLAIWGMAMSDLGRSVLGVLIGYGPGAWLRRFPSIQEKAQFALSEIHGQAHNEFVQLVYEGGIVLLVLMTVWVWSRRRTLAGSPALPGVVAAGVSSLTMFPFQIAATAVLALTLLGFATQENVK